MHLPVTPLLSPPPPPTPPFPLPQTTRRNIHLKRGSKFSKAASQELCIEIGLVLADPTRHLNVDLAAVRQQAYAIGILKAASSEGTFIPSPPPPPFP